MPQPRKREEGLARPRERKGGEVLPVTKGVARPYTVTPADSTWHPAVTRLYNSLWVSGQADYYQQSDVETAWLLCQELSLYMDQPRRSPTMLATLIDSFRDLLVTEGRRRQMRLELSTPETETTSAGAIAIEQYRNKLRSVSAS